MKNINEMIFEYPLGELTDDTEKNFFRVFKRLKKFKTISLFLLAGAMISFLLSCMTEILSVFLLVLTVVFTLAGTALLKKTLAISPHFLFIKAYEKEMELTILQNEKKTVCPIVYDDILSMKFENKYSKIEMCFLNEDGKMEVKTILLNSQTPEQGFFLWTAPELIKKFKPNKKKISKLFGSEEAYYDKIFSAPEEL